MGEGGREKRETERRRERKAIRREELVWARFVDGGGGRMGRIRGENSKCRRNEMVLKINVQRPPIIFTNEREKNPSCM